MEVGASEKDSALPASAPAKAEANRRNASRSTGPKSPAGKRRSSLNACKHGLLARTGLLLGDEKREDYDAFNESMLAALKPVGELEGFLVDRVVSCMWRLARLGRIECGLFDFARYQELEGRALRQAILALDPLHEMPYSLDEVLRQFGKAEADGAHGQEGNEPADAGDRARAEKECDDAFGRWQLARNVQHEEPAISGRAFARLEAEGHLAKLSRYEANIERALYRALHELQRLQARRAGELATPPLAVDVDVSGEAGG